MAPQNLVWRGDWLGASCHGLAERGALWGPQDAQAQDSWQEAIDDGGTGRLQRRAQLSRGPSVLRMQRKGTGPQEKASPGRPAAPSVHRWWEVPGTRGRQLPLQSSPKAHRCGRTHSLPRRLSTGTGPAHAPVAAIGRGLQGRAFGAAVFNASCSQAEGPPGRFVPTSLTV